MPRLSSFQVSHGLQDAQAGTSQLPVRSRQTYIAPTATSTHNPIHTASSLKRTLSHYQNGTDDDDILYTPPYGVDVCEEPQLVLQQELNDEWDELDEGNEDQRPIRYLNDFTIFDPGTEKLVSLSQLDEGGNQHLKATGQVNPCFRNDEDAGQEDGLDNDEDEPSDDNGSVLVRLEEIKSISFDYSKADDSPYVLTRYAWYKLLQPSLQYKSTYRRFIIPRTVAQIVISHANTHPADDSDAFHRALDEKRDSFGGQINQKDIISNIPDIKWAIDNEPNSNQLKNVPFVQNLLSERHVRPIPRRTRFNQLPVPRRRIDLESKLTGLTNLDVAVLRPENQNPTNVTPLIASLAKGLFTEELHVIGGKPKTESTNDREKRLKGLHRQLKFYIRRGNLSSNRIRVEFNRNDRVRLRFYTRAKVHYDDSDVEIYSRGDLVLIQIDSITLPKPGEKIKFPSALPDYFWFAIILYIDDNKMAHIQWLNHGFHLFLKEFCHPKELFLLDWCQPIPLCLILGKVQAHFRPSSIDNIPENEFFYRFKYDLQTAAFTSIDPTHLQFIDDQQLPDNCKVCIMKHEDQEAAMSRPIANGVTICGQTYHIHDFVLYQAPVGPAFIGHIFDICYPKRQTRIDAPTTVSLKKLGRITDINDLPEDQLRDSAHVFLTNEEVMVDLRSLIRVCYVLATTSVADMVDWTSSSVDHFYCTFRFDSIDGVSWSSRHRLSGEDIPVCTECVRKEFESMKRMKEFVDSASKLPTLDLFGGVGAFSRGLAEGSNALNVTHAIEVSPSAARTFRLNSPNTMVINQCVNTMLRYSIKTADGHACQVPHQLYDDDILVEEPIHPGSIKVIVAGFPCQSHSTLNMFKKKDDVKNNLILTTLSWIDFINPEYVFVENVPGFLRYNLNAEQKNQYTTEGGFDMGGLRLFIRALLDMGFQCRFGLLQAAHYGTPQGRIRFFAIACRDSLLLPDLPQPTHDFPLTTSLVIEFPDGKNVKPIWTEHGTAPHPAVTIHDAIHDLPRFDWKHPRRDRAPDERRNGIYEVICDNKNRYAGFEEDSAFYYHPPSTPYQVQARLREHSIKKFQHYTRCFLPAIVERVRAIPLVAGADYRSLPRHLWEFQDSHPISAVARSHYRPGAYGRLNENGYFPTTVTNVAPTAKQSRVLNPYCKRIVTVRELARSQGFADDFAFETYHSKIHVVTMHRQIGNAVPWPVSCALGRELRVALMNAWTKTREEAIKIEEY